MVNQGIDERYLHFNFFGKTLTLKITYALVILFLTGIALRLPNLNGTGLWMDEIHSAVGSDPASTLGDIYEYAKRDQPPLFFVLLHGWFKLFDYNDFSGRLFVVFTGALGIIAMYFLGKEIKNPTVGITGSFLTMINYFHVDFSRQMRFYPFVFLLTALSFIYFLRVFNRRRLTDFALYVLMTAALLNTHYFGMVVFVSQFIIFIIVIIIKKIRDVKFILSALVAGIFVGLSFLHWLPVVLSDLGISEFHVQPVAWYFPALYHWVYFRDIITCTIAAILIFMALRRMYFNFMSKSVDIGNIVLIGWVGLGFLIPLLYSLIKMPMMEYKYSFIVLPGVLIFAALGFEEIKAANIRSGIVVLLLLSFPINALAFKKLYYRKPFEEWREVTKEIMKTHDSTQIVYSNYAWYYRYYFKLYHLTGQPYPPRYSDFEPLTDQFQSVWVLTQTKYPDSGLTPDQQAYLTENFKLIRELNFIDTKAQHYQRK